MTYHWPSLGQDSSGTPKNSKSTQLEREQEQLRVVLRGLIRVVLAHAHDGEIRAAMSDVCTVAHKERIPVERVLILLRAEWDLTEKPGVPLWRLEEIRTNLATRCIEQFYGIAT